jgi:outer membrane protein TolC
MVAHPVVNGAAQSDTVYLSLPAALERAHEANPTLRAERAEARMAAQGVLDASRAFLPNLRLEIQGMRTNDPVAVFGLKLRQENFAMEDFDIAVLNRPDPYSGWNSSATVELPILAPEGLFGFSAARRGAAARDAAAERYAGATNFMVTRAYWDAQLAARKVETLEVALEAARGHATQAEALQEQGMVTGLDARLARIGAAAVETQLIAGRAEAANALSNLRALLAVADSQPVLLTDSLDATAASTATCHAGETDCYLSNRGDLTAYRLGSDAAAAMVRSAWSSNLPAIALFGNLGHYGRNAPLGQGGSNWTVGIGLRWNLFPGLAGVGAVRKAKAEHHAAQARYEAAERQAEVEVQSARRMIEAATEGVTVSTAADREAQEALEQARLRYRTGTSSITELLDVQAAATQATLGLHSARRNLYVALAALDFAYGVNDR